MISFGVLLIKSCNFLSTTTKVVDAGVVVVVVDAGVVVDTGGGTADDGGRFEPLVGVGVDAALRLLFLSPPFFFFRPIPPIANDVCCCRSRPCRLVRWLVSESAVVLLSVMSSELFCLSSTKGRTLSVAVQKAQSVALVTQ